MPTTPSGATTGLYWLTPALLPAVSVSVVMTSSACPDVCSASAGTNPHVSFLPRPSSLRRRSFSTSSARAFENSSARESRCSVRASLSSHAARQRSALRCIPTRGATIVRRRPLATGSRMGAGSALATSARITHPTKTTVSKRPLSLAAPPRAIARSAAEYRPVLLLVVQDPAGAANHARQRIFVYMDGEPGLLAQQQIQAA